MKDLKNQYPAITAGVFCLVALIAFYWAWTNSLEISKISEIGEDYSTINIDSYKSSVDKILSGRVNIVDMPLGAPDTGVGRTNPFAGL